MTQVNDEVGRRVAEARERRGLTQADVASRSGIGRPTLSKLENGQQSISISHLVDLAEALDMRVEWLLSDPPAAIVSHRGSSRSRLASIDIEVERMAREVELVASESHSFASVLGRLPVLDPPQDARAVEEMAGRARDLLGAPRQGPLHDLGELMGRLGVMLFSVDLGPDEADAATVLLEHGAVSVVNAHLRTGRRRLSAAHELGHALLADDYTVDYALGDHTGRTESQLDQFGRALLLPADSTDSRWKALRDTHVLREAAVIVASEYRVDMATLARRLRELSAISGSQAAEIRRTVTTREDIVEWSLVPADELRVGFLPATYREAVLDLYLDERLSPERTVELLRGTCTEGDLPEPPPLSADRIWQFV